jgi:cysteine desulfurase
MIVMEWIYLDNNATTQPAAEVVDAMDEVQRKLWANPSSVHRFGQMVRHRVEQARASVASLISARPREIVFTSGGSEANNLALTGVLSAGPGGKDPGPGRKLKVLVTARTEHSAIREPAEVLGNSGVDVIYLPVDSTGRVDPADLRRLLDEQPGEVGRVLASIQWANNETGVIQPVAALAQVCEDARRAGSPVLFHCDATQAVGKIPVDVGSAGIDLMTLSAHKFHGPKGVGALYVRRGARVHRQIHGGPQERERRGGTENTAGIVAMGVAADLAGRFVADCDAIAKLRAWRDRFEQGICRQLPGTVVNSKTADPLGRIWNTSNLGFARLEAEAILLGLSERGLCASAGAACSTGSLEPSPVLLAMGIAEPVAHVSVRISLSRMTTLEQIDQATAILPDVVRRVAQSMRVGV